MFIQILEDSFNALTFLFVGCNLTIAAFIGLGLLGYIVALQVVAPREKEDFGCLSNSARLWGFR